MLLPDPVENLSNDTTQNSTEHFGTVEIHWQLIVVSINISDQQREMCVIMLNCW